MSSTLTAAFTNTSTVTFYRDFYDTQVQSGVGGLTTQPGQILRPNAGHEALEYDQHSGGFISTGDAGIWLCWNDGKVRFGVKLWAPWQQFGIGKRPYWYQMHDTNVDGGEPDWGDQLDSSEFTWPTSVGYKIIATPDSDHDSLKIDVTIDNLG